MAVMPGGVGKDWSLGGAGRFGSFGFELFEF